ncbi:BON domain-containing protein [Lacunimicrobium album]
MLLKRQWILTVGVLAVAPTVTMAAPWGKDKADAAAQTAGVDNQQVANSLAAELKKAKQAGVPIEGQDVKIVYQNGVATIQGKIKDANQKTVVTQILKNYPGVTQVNNEMTLMSPQVRTAMAPTPAAPPRGMITQASYDDTPLAAPAPPAGVSNQAMAQQIAQAMEMAGIQGQDMEIRFKSGTATIIGAVFSPEQRMVAEQVVGQVPGVGAVDNQLQVAGGAPMQAAYPQPGMPPMQGMPQMQGMPPMQGMPAMPASYQQGMAPPAGMMPPSPGYSASSSNMVYNQPNMPQHSWPTYAAYPNSAAVSYPKQYSASAFPYIGPFYPYPQVPLGWRKSSLVWEDGSWQLEFDSKTDRWWWFMHPKNW